MFSLEKLIIIQDNLFLSIQDNLSYGKRVVIYMKNFCQLMGLISKFILLEEITLMQRHESVRPLMEKFNEIKMEKK